MKIQQEGGASDKIRVLPQPLPVDELILIWKLVKHLEIHPEHDYSHITTVLESMTVSGLNIVVKCYLRMAKADDPKAPVCRKVAIQAGRTRSLKQAA